MTEADWLEAWEHRIAGLALNGLEREFGEPPAGKISAGQYALKLPGNVRRLMIKMYRTAQPEYPKESTNAKNGTDKTPPARPGNPGDGANSTTPRPP